MSQNMANILALAQGSGVTSMLDLGCDAGGRTTWLAERVGATELHGVEIADDRAELARARGIDVTSADLNGPFPYEDERVDLVVSNQVIEHLHDTDSFVREVFRVLRPGGVAVVSTENLASWHNIGSLVLGWQPFSLTNISTEAAAVGNPLGVHRGAPGWDRGHLRVLSYRGLRELFELHGFQVEALRGAGYYPLPRRFARLDPRHAAFLTIKARRPG
jgi:SAM-dependent methyltransferase